MLKITCISAYRQYNSHLPKRLHNQPRQFITHCCQHLTHAQSITKEDISQEGDGQFLVKSQSDNKISYQVHFGDCSNMPSCTCPDWQRHHWPCKHYVAIYKHFPEWGWEAKKINVSLLQFKPLFPDCKL